jgi:hypothetical protein
MAITTSWNYTQTGNPKNLPVPDIDFSKFTQMDKSTKSEKWLNNLTSSLDIPETAKFKITNIGNIYDKTEILPVYYATSKAGRELFWQLNDILTASDSENPTFSQDLPVSGYVALKFPTNALMTSDALLTFYERLVSMVLDTGAVTKSRLEAMMHGSSIPSNIG